MNLPPLSAQDIIEQNLGDEILLFNLKTNKALSLNKTAAAVYKYCDGQTDLEKVCRDEGLSKEVVYLSLKELEKENLVELEKDSFADLKNTSRREVIRKVGAAGFFALPVLSVIIAPTAAMAQSGLFAANTACSSPSQCQSNSCAPRFTTTPPQFFPQPPICFPGPPGPPICFGAPPICLPGPPGPPTCISQPPQEIPGVPIVSGFFCS